MKQLLMVIAITLFGFSAVAISAEAKKAELKNATPNPVIINNWKQVATFNQENMCEDLLVPLSIQPGAQEAAAVKLHHISDNPCNGMVYTSTSGDKCTFDFKPDDHDPYQGVIAVTSGNCKSPDGKSLVLGKDS